MTLHGTPGRSAEPCRSRAPAAALGVWAAGALLAGTLAAQSGTVAGGVRLVGDVERQRPVAMEADPYCLATSGRKVRPGDVVVNKQGGLANVFVRLDGAGLEAAAGAPPAEPVRVEQRGCIYEPRMVGARVGQTLRVVNLDDTIHNVRSLSEVGSDFNIGQPFSGMEFDFELTTAETMLRLRCDIHPWMRAFIGVVGHPWFAVTAEDGGFELTGVPPGDYEIVTWHERFGTQRLPVSVGADGRARLDVEYRAER